MAVSNSLANRPQQKLDFGVYLTQEAAKKEINKVLGGQAGTCFISSIISAVQATPALCRVYKFIHSYSGPPGGGIEAFTLTPTGAVLPCTLR